MTAEERAEARLTTEVLGAARRTDLLSIGLTLLATVALFLRLGSAPLVGLSIVFGLVVRYYGFRLALDSKLFDDLANGRMELADLDFALRAMTGGRAGSTQRSVAERCQGARRLVSRHAFCTVIQLAVASIAGIVS
ncbi:MAG: hypothetical protein HYU52_18155 [Acidobacteria bacterium]|nr:hypothetical protein [Acidobacteriota bacterium]